MPITDRLDVAELFARLARMLDERRHDEIDRVYHPGIAVHSPRGELHGLAEVTEFLTQQRDELAQHVHSDILVDLDGERATATANQLVYFYREGEPPHRRSGVRLTTAMAKTAEGWRFTDMGISPAWIKEN
ncbi:nuclear transport factor 2 family protein [Amycolatopsis dendrobii]|uniref:Nuclear transport factor 2 family protein n=1 Tax=Amycolatopsis dendrobii TaxID=2760662 RepID=A0A7W3VYE7_9PSEU|nr:nuclear transport factor 2 family protein [Amycolatopsis dendrobii]MBB1155440.1 nuclear transport factor 2 family protein [Amycolatopsis dendrobii]